MGFSCKFPLKPIYWEWVFCAEDSERIPATKREHSFGSKICFSIQLATFAWCIEKNDSNMLQRSPLCLNSFVMLCFFHLFVRFLLGHKSLVMSKMMTVIGAWCCSCCKFLEGNTSWANSAAQRHPNKSLQKKTTCSEVRLSTAIYSVRF